MKYVVLTTMLIWSLSGAGLRAQYLSPDVVAAGGDWSQNPLFGTLHWTIGEPMVETYTPGMILTQGFHQVYHDLLVSVGPPPPADIRIGVYPNPTSGWVIVEVSPLPRDLTLEVYNLVGKRVLTQNLTDEQTTLHIDHLASGIYLFSIRNNAFIYRTFKVKKTNF